jgi:archaeosine synthase
MLSSEELDWEPLSKEEFFELTQKWLVKPNIDYDVRKREAPPTWKAWLPRFSEENEIKCDCEEDLKNSKFETWQKFLTNKYNPPEHKDIALFVSDYQDRPLSKNDFYEKVKSALEELGVENKIHMLLLSAPGVIPSDFTEYYPFNSYKWQEDGLDDGLKEKYVEITEDRVLNYLKNHRMYYKDYIFFFDSGSLNCQVGERAKNELDAEAGKCIVYDKDMSKDNIKKKFKGIVG